MIRHKINNKNFIGPKALFDPTYIPPRLLYRNKEENSLGSILSDSISDDFSLNILYQGIRGIGKKSLIIKVLNDFFPEINNSYQLKTLNINCKNKTIEEVLFTLLIDINKKFSYNININHFLNSDLSHLWTTFKLAIRKQDNPILILFTNIDDLNEKSFKKILQYGKETRTPILSTANKVLRCSTLDILNEFDLKKKLSYFTYQELKKILKQRVDLAFSSNMDNELIEFLTDLIYEYYVPVPGKGIDILKELYPYLTNRSETTQGEILKISKTQFDSIPSSDEINLFSYISQRDILTLLFLDNLSSHFEYSSSYYITMEELKELFLLSIESIEYNFKEDRFRNIIKMLQNVGILSLSKKKKSRAEKFFMTIDKEQLKYIIDACFSDSPLTAN